MKNDEDFVVAAITPREMFRMIEDFADGLLEYLREEHGGQSMDTGLIMSMFQQVLDVLHENKIEGRVGIIIMLQAACAMYRTSLEQTSPCPPERLN